MHSSDQFSVFAAEMKRHFSDALKCQEFKASDRQPWPFEEMALALFRLHSSLNPAYRTWCRALGCVPQNVRSWAEIPALPVAAFKEMEVTCLEDAARKRVFISSGTSGSRSRNFHSDQSIELYEAACWPWFAAHLGVKQFQEHGDFRLLCLTPAPNAAPTSSLVHMFEVVRQRLGVTGDVYAGSVTSKGDWELDIPSVLEGLKECASNCRPVLLLGTAFSFVHLLDAMDMDNTVVKLPPGSRFMETGGYKGRSRVLSRNEFYQSLCRRFGLRQSQIISEYGMSELSSQAYALENDAKGNRFFRFPPWARARIVSPETGREVDEGGTGLIQILDLANVFSVLCLQTEDLGKRRGEGFELLGRAESAVAKGCSLMVAHG